MRENLEENTLEKTFLPLKRPKEFSEVLLKKPKRLPVSYEEWEPFSKALLSLNFSQENDMSIDDIEERKNIALKMSTPEGLFEIISELEQKLSKYEDVPNDPEFEKLSIDEKIEKLYYDYCH